MTRPPNQATNLVSGTTPMFAPTGHLVFWREGSLWAVPFDPVRLEMRGDPVPVVEGVDSFAAGGAGAYTVADNGTLIYQPSRGSSSTLGWVNRAGEMTTPLLGEDQTLLHPRLSPHGTRVAFTRRVNSQSLYVRDLERGAEIRITESGDVNGAPAWKPEGATVKFASDRGDSIQVYTRPVDLSQETALLLSSRGISSPGGWTTDGQTLVYFVFSDTDGGDLWSVTEGEDPVVFLATEFNERTPRPSPNGEWVAYVSDRAGESRIFVTAFPGAEERFSISTGPGTEPVWSRDGRELFYRNGNQMWVVDMQMEGGLRPGTPRPLFEERYELDPIDVGFPNYDVSLDDQQFLMVRSDAPETQGYVVVQNWFEELKRLVPVD